MSWFKAFLNKANNGTPEEIAKKWMEENPEAVADFITEKQRADNEIKATEMVNELPVQNPEIKNEEVIDLEKLNDEIAGN